MPSKKGSIAYENRLARRRAQRAINRMEKELNSGELSRSEAFQKRGEIAALREAIAGTYIGRRGHEIRTKEEAQRAARSIVEREYVRIAADRQAQNIQVMQEISNTYYVDKVTHQHVQNPMSSYSEAEMRTFWRATQEIWDRKDVPRDKRFEAIVKYVANAQGIDPAQVNLHEFIDAIINDKAADVANWQREIEQKNAKKASGADIGEDEMQEFSSEDIVKYITEKSINAVLEKYRQREESQDETQEV